MSKSIKYLKVCQRNLINVKPYNVSLGIETQDGELYVPHASFGNIRWFFFFSSCVERMAIRVNSDCSVFDSSWIFLDIGLTSRPSGLVHTIRNRFLCSGTKKREKTFERAKLFGVPSKLKTQGRKKRFYLLVVIYRFPL